jgi:hypothetical protein
MPEVSKSQQPAMWAEAELARSEPVTAPVAVETEREARLKPVNRNQLLLRTVDVDSLVQRDHLVRAIWELTERLDLRGFTADVGSVEGAAARPAFDRVCSSVYGYMPTAKG